MFNIFLRQVIAMRQGTTTFKLPRVITGKAPYFLFLFLLCPVWAFSAVNVVTTTEDLAAIAQEVGGQWITANSISRGYQDTHYVDPKPSYMVLVNRANLLIYTGLDLESSWLPQLIEGSRNRQIRFGQIGHLDVSTAVEHILEIPSGPVDRSMGDVHPFGNPHYTNDPINAIAIAQAIADRLGLLDPEHSAAYKINAEQFSAKIKTKLKEWQARLAPFKGAKIVTYHREFSYFFNRFGLEYLGNVEIRPGILPSPKHLAELAVEMKRHNCKLIINENYFPTQWSDLLASKTGAKVVVMPMMVNGSSDVPDYIRLIDYTVERFAQELASAQTGGK
jgi:ABC-type Zn uptake system ZnuABC Zn-binding protein ZnuA